MLIPAIVTVLSLSQATQPAGGDVARRGRLRPAPLRDMSLTQRDMMQVDRWVQRATRTYKLDSTQQVVVRAELEAYRQERLAQMGSDAGEYERLRKELIQFWNDPGNVNDSGKADRELWRRLRQDPKVQELRGRMREIETKYPFDWAGSEKRIEKVIPAELVQEAHERQDERRKAAAARRIAASPFAPPTPGGISRKQGSEASKEAAGAVPVSPSPPPHPWESFTREFIRVNQLDAGQSNAAFSILKDLRGRAERIETANSDRVAAARLIPEQPERDKRLSELNRPIEELFQELKVRLDGLLNSSQRAAAKVRDNKSPDSGLDK